MYFRGGKGTKRRSLRLVTYFGALIAHPQGLMVHRLRSAKDVLGARLPDRGCPQV